MVAESRRWHRESAQSGSDEGRDQPFPAAYSRTTRAGTPATTQWPGTWPRTTAPAATTTFRPMLAPGRMTAPAPIQQPGADRYRGVARPLAPDRHLGIAVAVVLVGDVDIRAGENIVTDQDRVVRDDVAAAPDHAAVAHPQHRAVAQVLAGQHARTQRDLRPDHGLVADLDPALAVDGAGREGHQGPGAERREPAPGTGVGSDHPSLLHDPPGLVDQVKDAARPRLRSVTRQETMTVLAASPRGQVSRARPAPRIRPPPRTRPAPPG